MFLYSTPELGLQKVTVWVMTDESWPLANRRYSMLLSAMTERYSDPDSSYDFIMSPYDDMQGLECRAFSLDKGNFAAFWFNNKTMLQVDEDCDVQAAYEDPRFEEYLIQEREEMTSDF